MNTHPPIQLRTVITSSSRFSRRKDRGLRLGLGLRLRSGLKKLEGVTAEFVCLLALLTVASADAQAIRFRAGQVRVTVPINSGNSTTITNQVNLTGVTNADLSVSGLPAGASAVITDTNGVAVTTVTTDTNLLLTVNTTNIAEGIYTFSLNASGIDTNGAPVMNYVSLVLQAAHLWKGANGPLGVSNAWSTASSWLGGVPAVGNDVVFTDLDAQSNVFPSGISFSNSFVDVNTTIGSLRFSQTGLTNAFAGETNTPPRFHTLRINPGVTLSITGTNGLSMMRDYIDDIQGLGSMTVNIVGGVGSKMIVSNANANIAILLGNQAQPTLNMSNLESMVTYVSRLGLAEYQLFPNYRNYNDLNQFNDNPRRFIANVYLPRTNIVTAIWKDADNYNNELTRTYAMSYQDSEVSGVGSSVNTFYYLGQSNAFFLDSVCFIRANHATGNGGAVRFNPVFASPTALFRGTNGGRMSVFTVSDDGGTNNAASNVKATIDFATGNGLVDLLVDRLYVSRDRTMIASNQTPNVQGDLTFGRGTVDANTVILGFQEHTNKTDWTTIGGAQPYLNYCQGRLFLTNGGTFKVNGTLTLGYTADTNPEGSAQQFNTYGQITVYTNTTLAVSNLIVDGGLNFASSTPRRNDITLNQGATMIITNTIGGAPGLPLDDLIMNGATNVMFVTPTRTNIIVRNLQTPGVTPSVIRIASLSGVSSYPVQIPLISYETAAPFLVANVAALGAGFSGYVLDNQPNKTVDVYITTNPPNSLIWRGNVSADWDTTTRNWVTAVGGVQTNFSIGDAVTFDDSSTVNNINVVGSVVPGQSGNGVTVNATHNYNFSGPFGATIAGTSLLVKQGSGTLNIDVAKQGPVTLNNGAITGNGSIGTTTVFSNATLNFSGFINGGLTSTGAVTIAASGLVFGPVNIRGGTLNNAGTISNTPTAMAIFGNATVTNGASGNMYVGGGQWTLSGGSVLANYGTIYNLSGRLNVAAAAAPFDGGIYTGTGAILDPDSGLITGIDGRFAVNPTAIWSPGSPTNAIGTMNVGARIDLNNTPASGLGTLVIEVDFNNPQTNDIVLADKWNNITGMILMTNINPGAGSFASGQVFPVFINNNGAGFVNTIDVNGTYPTMWPPLPGPGLQWGLFDFRAFGTISVTNTPLVWDGTVNGSWDTNTANWKAGLVYADNQGALFDDSANGTTVITLTNVVAPAGFDVTTNIVGGVTNLFTNGPAMIPGIVVSNASKNYTITGPGKITGLTGLYKAGPGTLTILTSNDFRGNTILAGGTVAITNALGLGGGPVDGSHPNELFIDGGTLKYIGSTNASLPRVMVINPNNATVEVTFATNELTASTILGTGALTKTGPGTLVLGQAADAYAGGTTISAGPLRLTAAAAGTGGITLTPNTTLQFTNSFTFTNGVNISGSPTTFQVLGNATNISSGLWSGSGSVTLVNTGAVQLVLNAAMTNFSGTLSQGTSTNNIRFNNSTNSNPNRGSTATTFDLGTGASSLNNLNGNNLTYDLGALTGGPNTVLFGSSTNMGVPACTYSIGANGNNTTFLGRITNGVGAVSIAKVGAGTLTLGGSSTYSGGTTISGGTLLVNNTAGSGTGSGAVSVTGGTLGGTGAISGAVSVGAGGNLAPGTSIGTLAINNSLSLAGTTTVEVSRNGFTLTGDRVVGLTSVSFGGSLVVNNIGPDALVQGNSFQLFNTGGTGNFASITPPLPLPLAWSFNTATGVLSVSGPQPTLNYVNNGNSVTFSWVNGGGNTFKLQAQTNGIDVGISNNWFDYPGGGTSGVTAPLDHSQGTVFFRLVSTP